MECLWKKAIFNRSLQYCLKCFVLQMQLKIEEPMNYLLMRKCETREQIFRIKLIIFELRIFHIINLEILG